MYVKIQVSEKKEGNKGSVDSYVRYLEKEDLQKEKESLKNRELPEKREGFFNQNEVNITGDQVIDKIDNNKQSLGKNDAKFYSIILSPSEYELKHILGSVTNKDIRSVKELDSKELKLYEEKLRDFTKETMDIYAKHFKRESVKDAKDLVYFGKIEHERKTKEDALTDFNSHIHIIVSRMDINMKTKLSPLAKERGGEGTAKIGDRKVQRGFDRMKFDYLIEQKFDEIYAYDRKEIDKFENKLGISKGKIIEGVNLPIDKKPKTKSKSLSKKPKLKGLSDVAKESEKGDDEDLDREYN